MFANRVEVAAAANHHAPVINTAAVVTYAAVAGRSHALYRVDWSYDAAPTGGALTITDGGVTVFKVFITAAGPGFQKWGYGTPLLCASNSELKVTLAAGGATATGLLTCQKITR